MSRIYLLLALAGWFLVGYHLILWVFLSLLIFCCSWLSIFYRWQNVNNFYVISVEFNWAISRFCRIWFIRLLQAHWQITCISPLVKSLFKFGSFQVINLIAHCFLVSLLQDEYSNLQLFHWELYSRSSTIVLFSFLTSSM